MEVPDNSIAATSAVDFFRLRNMRDAHVASARMAQQFISANRNRLSLLDVEIEQSYNGRDVHLIARSGSAVGAIPLLSPFTAKADYGVVVQPRFSWVGLGPMLAEMGWRIVPIPLSLPLLKRSERRVPIWVLSFMILARLKELLDSIDRQFEIVHQTLPAPRGSIHWGRYATRSVARMALLDVPCSFPDLREDRILLGAIHYCIDQQLRALEGQRAQGPFVHRLIEFATGLLRQVEYVPPVFPQLNLMKTWRLRPMSSERYANGLEAIEWTVEERGLAGLSDLAGIPWKIPMDAFFEAWVETVFEGIVRQTGGHLKVGRKRATLHPISWEPPYRGTQKFLWPDLIVEWESLTLIVDAKYKRHWEELQHRTWMDVEAEIREQHREDLLQVLAYANLARTDRVVSCVVYPCSLELWQSLNERRRLIHKADITAGTRSVSLWLTAVPMTADARRVDGALVEEVRRLLLLDAA